MQETRWTETLRLKKVRIGAEMKRKLPNRRLRRVPSRGTSIRPPGDISDVRRRPIRGVTHPAGSSHPGTGRLWKISWPGLHGSGLGRTAGTR